MEFVQTDTNYPNFTRAICAESSFNHHIESLSAEQVKALDEASQIDPGFPYHLYAKESVRAIAFGGVRDQILA